MPRRQPAVEMAATVLVLVATVAAAGARPAQAPGGAGRLLDVPYLPQTEDLCGGAAVAMVMRYWGERQIFPDDFAALVDRSAAGIRTSVLAADVSRRGWQALPYAADAPSGADSLRGHVDNGRPVIVLVEVRPGRYHYVVVVAVTAEQVIAHDPAQAPFRVWSRADFDRDWEAGGRWALLVLPSAARRSADERPAAAPGADPSTPGDACGSLVQEMVARARGGDIAGADIGLSEATRLCPHTAGAWRELAGVRFLQSRWADASALAERASQLEPGDGPGWELLATSRFLNDQPGAALDAWNQVGRPEVDLLRVEGAVRTRHPVIAGLIDLPPRTLLTAERFARAGRRLRELPGAGVTRLGYRPGQGGLADIEAAIVERASLPRGVVPIVAAAARAGMQRELRVDAATPTGSGELWTLAWRWWEARPRVAFALAVPSPAKLPGITTVEAFWERQSYGRFVDDGRSAVETSQVNERRRAAFRVADWATSRLRWEAGVALDRWGDQSHASAEAALDTRLAGDRLSLGIDVAAWTPLGSGQQFARGGVWSAWRSSVEGTSRSWLASAGLLATGHAAPLDLWPGASAGHGRAPFLRAHPLLAQGVIVGDVFGQRLAHGTAEYQHPLLTTLAGTIRVAVFADAAHAWDAPASRADSGWHVDAGAGLRVGFPGNAGTARIDLARGLRDGSMALSAGWQPPWPGR